MNQIAQLDPVTPDASSVKAWRVVNIHAGASKGDLSSQWFSRPADQRFLSLSDLYDAKKKQWDESTQLTIANRKLEAVAPEPQSPADFSKLTFGLPNGAEVNSSHWAFGQVCGLAQLPANIFREKLPTQITADAINWSMRYNRDVEDVKVFYQSNGGDLMRAVTGPDYGRVGDYLVVEALMRAIEKHPRWKVPGVMDWGSMTYDPNHPVTMESTTIFGSDRDVFIFLVDDLHPIKIGEVMDQKTGRMEPDYVFRGFYVTNSEVGKGALKICTFYLRAICCNRIMWGVEGFEELTIRHSKYALDRWIEEAQPALETFAANSDARLLEGVARAKAKKLAESNEEAMAFLKGRSFSKTRIDRILSLVETEEGHPARSAWDFAQGITAMARDIPNTDDRLSIELTAKAILDKVA